MNDIILHTNQGSLTTYFTGISEKAHKLRNTSTPGEKIKVRKGKGGKSWKYIQRIDAMEWLDKNYPGWSMEVDTLSFKEYAGFVYATVKLSVIENIGDTALKREIKCTGCDEIEFTKETNQPVSMTYYKNAETDALKRCVFSLGGFKDVYSEEELEDIQQQICTDEDIDWFIQSVLPVLNTKHKDKLISSRNYLKTISGFLSGEISKELIVKALNSFNTQ